MSRYKGNLCPGVFISDARPVHLKVRNRSDATGCWDPVKTCWKFPNILETMQNLNWLLMKTTNSLETVRISTLVFSPANSWRYSSSCNSFGSESAFVGFQPGSSTGCPLASNSPRMETVASISQIPPPNSCRDVLSISCLCSSSS